MNCKKEAGFTLLELIVVMALLGMIAVLAVPQYNCVLDNVRLKADAKKMARVLQIARQEAITTGQGKTVYFYPQTTKYTVRDGDTYWFNSGIAYNGSTTFSEHEDKPACVFSPSGVPSSAGTVTLNNRQGKRLYVIVSVAAGRIRVSEGPPESWE
ncbi:MAG: GspH/FimT family pseudopilin [Syntrophomonadaceae bacterium]|nr:GspH/FimT family pseudopilin [Syntrophomonadaceae bacterium]